jgi:hypothetical protein
MDLISLNSIKNTNTKYPLVRHDIMIDQVFYYLLISKYA